MSIQYALINPDNAIDRMSFNIDPDVETKPGWKWIPVVDEIRPPYNSELQVAENFVDIQETQVLRGWTIRDKTAEEIYFEKLQKVNSIDPTVIAALLNHENRILTLENQPTITLEEYKTKIRDLI